MPSLSARSISSTTVWLALKERTDPVGVLRRKVRVNAGRQYAISDVRQAVLAQYAAHKSWSVQLHHDNLAHKLAWPAAHRSACRGRVDRGDPHQNCIVVNGLTEQAPDVL